MKYVTSHMVGVKLQNHKLMGLPYNQIPFTTLNELFNVQAGVAPDGGATPTMTYLAIGNGGHINALSADNIPYPQLVQHGPRDCALINHLPFVLREVSDDLTVAERAKYAMRQTKVIGGVNYVAYYLRKLDLSEATVQMLVNTVTDGVVTSVPWVPTSSNLHPVPSTASNTGAVVTSGEYVSAQTVIDINFDETDLAELQNAANILYGSPNLAIISEAALVAAYPKIIDAAVIGGGTITYEEAVGAIICSSLSAYYHIPSLNKSLDLTFEVGGAESLFGVTDGTTTVTGP